MKKSKKYAVVISLIIIATVLALKVYSDYCYDSGMKGKIITFTSPRDYNFDFGTLYNDQYTMNGEPNANIFTLTDNTLQWYVPSGSWGIVATFLNETYWKQYFTTLTLNVTFIDTNGKIETFILGYTPSVEYPTSPLPYFVINGADNGHIQITYNGVVNPNLVAGEVDIPCTAIVRWCPAPTS
jgi:hypothetical protein